MKGDLEDCIISLGNDQNQKDSFKKLLDVKAKEYSLKTVLKKKQQLRKIENLEYHKLETQCY